MRDYLAFCFQHIEKGDDAMAQTVTASVKTNKMTDGQIDNVVDKLRSAMRKHRFEITSEVAQQVLGVENLGMEMFAVFRKHAEMMDNLIVRRAKIDRSRMPQDILKSTGRKQYVDDSVVAGMPRGEGEEIDVIFFKPDLSKRDGWINDDDLDKEYESRGLKPADPYSQAAVNEADPSFADEHPNATHWKDKNGKWCFAVFRRWDDVERSVSVHRYDRGWYGDWWFAGLRK
jgi:hypothetical protein